MWVGDRQCQTECVVWLNARWDDWTDLLFKTNRDQELVPDVLKLHVLPQWLPRPVFQQDMILHHYSHIMLNHPNHMMPGKINRTAPIVWPPRSPNKMCYMKNLVYQDKNDNCQQFNAHIQGTVVTVTDNMCQSQVDRGWILSGYWSCHQDSSHWNLLW